MAPWVRVLVVDDEVVFTENLARLLNTRGFAAETAFDGHGALEAVRTRASYDVVLLDVKMPGMDGIQVLKSLKSMVPEVEVIMLTGDATVEIGIEAIRAGAFDYLIKPCDIEDLSEKLRATAALKRIRRYPVLWPRSTAGEVILYSFRKLTTNDPLIFALEVFNSDRRKMAGETLFIVDAEDVLRGAITQQALVDAACAGHPERNMTWEALQAHPEWLPDCSIGDVMSSGVTATEPDAPLITVATSMIECGMHSMPVVDGGRVVGIVRLRDVLRYLEAETTQEI